MSRPSLLRAATAVLAFCICVHSVYAASRIINGIPAGNSEFPFAISLQERSQLGQATRGHSCGGALITLQHAVTTAACCYAQNAQGVYVPKQPSAYRVFAGAFSLLNDSSVNHWRIVSNFSVHPNYTGPPATFNDIAVITLLNAFFNTTVVPIPMSAVVPEEYADCTAAGWGTNNHGQILPSTQLMSSQKYVYPQQMCAIVLNPQPNAPNVLPFTVCAAPYDTRTVSCTNDTGNALVCGGVLAGVLSWHPPCAAATSWPDLYTRTANYTVWVRSITGGAPLAARVPALAALLLLAAAAALAHAHL